MRLLTSGMFYILMLLTITIFKNRLDKYFDSNPQLKYYSLLFVGGGQALHAIIRVEVIVMFFFLISMKEISCSFILFMLHVFFIYLCLISSFPASIGWRQRWLGRNLRIYCPVPLTLDQIIEFISNSHARDGRSADVRFSFVFLLLFLLLFVLLRIVLSPSLPFHIFLQRDLLPLGC